MNSSENSSEEADQQEDDCGGTRRSYECTFCRRGFTNAQALGGHMNIHRKDRAKAKQPNSSSSNKKLIISSDIINEEPLLSSPYLSGQPTRYSNNNYSIFEAQRSYNMYFQPASNPRNPPTPPSSYGFPYDCEYINARSHHHHHHQAMDMNQELLGPNLNLQIGPTPSPVENNEVVRRGIQKDGDVDLELRLGHHPYY